MDQETNPASVRFIRETAENDDQFGAHSRLAEAIVTALKSDPPLRVVGLVGAWGSGKSTVVRLVEAKLSGRAARLFLHDAWLHQSDAPRRAFLEELLRWIGRQELGDVSALQEQLDKLLGKSELTKSTVTPKVSAGAGLALATLLLLPLASQFIRVDWMKLTTMGLYGQWGLAFSRPFVWAVAVTLLPFTLLSVTSIIHVIRARKGKEGASAVAALFANKVSEVRTDLKTRDADPTALEFQQFFRQVLEHIGRQTQDRLVIVIDNIDRLPDAEMLSLWSTIRSLFHGDTTKGEKAPVPPTVLLPIDENAMIRSHEHDPLIADGFADKTFDVVFRVPTPVLSQWQAYLGCRIEDVFENSARREWTEAAARILEEAGADGRTPRSINAFVNQVATLWLQWGDEISFAAMAYYAAHRRLIEKDAWGVLKNPAPWMFDFDPDWTSGVAALRYGVRPEIAGQILIEPPVRKAFVDFDAEALKRLVANEGFAIVVRRLIDGLRYGNQTVPVTHAALLLDTLDTAQNSNFRAAWGSLADGFVNAPGWSPLTDRDVAALKVLLRRTSGSALARIIAGVSQHVLQIQEPILRASLPTILAAVEAAGRSAKAANLPPPRATLQGGADTMIMVATAAPQDGYALRLLQPQVAATQLASAVAKAVTDGRLSEAPDLLRAMNSWQLELPWAVYVDELWSALDDFDDSIGERVLEGLIASWEQAPTTRAAIAAKLSGEPFQSRLSETLHEGHSRIGAMLTLALAANIPLGQPAAALRRLLAQRPALALELEDRLAQAAPRLKIGDLVTFTDANSEARPVTAAVIDARLRKRPNELQVEDIARRPLSYMALSGQAEDLLWRTAAASKAFWRALLSNPSDEDTRPVVRLLLEDQGRISSLDDAAIAMATLLARAPVDEWRQAIVGGGSIFDDLKNLTDSMPAAPVAGSLSKALMSLIGDLLIADGTPLARNWFYAASCVPRAARRRIHKHLGSRILDGAARNPIALVEAGGERLLRATLELDAPDAFFALILEPALTQEIHLDWVASHAAIIRPWIKAAPPTVARRLKVIIGRLASSLALEDPRKAPLRLLQSRE